MKNLLRFLAFVLMVGSAYSQSNLPNCEGRLPNAWFNCYGTFTTFLGNKYIGEFKDGRFNGQGTFFYLANDQFKGDKYVGEWKDGKRNGQGTLTLSDGSKHVGEFKDDKRHGQGALFSSIGSVTYQGIWADNNFVGTAPLKQESRTNQMVATATQQSNISQSNLPACSVSGNFENCFGTYTLPSGEKYVGEFKNNLRHGLGIFYTSSGLVVSEGIWADGKFLRSATVQKVSETNSEMVRLRACQGITETWNNCFGEATYPSGDTYAGAYKDGKRNGQGTYTFKISGNKYEGEFVDNTRQGKGAFTLSNGDKYVGDFKDGKADGLGVMTFAASGNKYEGEFKDLKRSGQGIFTYSDGRVALGDWLDGKPNGQLIEYKADKTISRAGIYKDGKFIRVENISPSTFTRISTSLLTQFNYAQQVENQSLKSQAEDAQRKIIELENQRLKAQAEDAKRKQAELEEQLRVAKLQNQVNTSSAMTTMANRKALVIGNDTYKSITKLLNAREDAKAIATNLTAFGYKVTLQLDLNEKEMKAALRTFSSQVQGGDEVMFFFAGHGVQLGATNYLLPTDIGGESEAQVKDEAIQLQRVLDDMTEKKAKFTLAMIDACRDNPFKSAGRNIGGRGLAPTTAATGQMVVFSAGTGQQALDRLGNTDKNKNGVFTRTFLKEMQKPGVSIDRIVKNVRNEVAELAKTVGHEQVPAIYDQVLGDFYFKK